MAKIQTKEVLELIPTLPMQEVKRIRDHCTVALQLLGKQTEVEHNDWLLEGIFSELRKRGLRETLPSNFRLKNSRSFAGYLDKSKLVRDALLIAVPDLSRAEEYALGDVVARSLVRYVEAFSDVSVESVLRHVQYVPQALEKSFPGYLASGMLRALLKTGRENLNGTK
jgi:hypothetical protein